MVLDAKIAAVKNYYGIAFPADWQAITTEQVLKLDGIGPSTLEHIRIYLAMQGLTLKNDQTPEYWKQHIGKAKIGHVMGHEDIEPDCDRGIIAPFTILIDTAEQEPFTFDGLRADADQNNRPWIVPTERQCLGRHPDSLGDYSITTGLGRCHIERKSMHDAHGTILGFKDGRRERFEQELSNLSQLQASCVIVECSLADLIRNAPAWGTRTALQNAKVLQRSIISFQQEFRVPWLFADSRKMAQSLAFRWFYRFHEKQLEEVKKQNTAIARAKRAEKKQEEVDRQRETERELAEI